MTARWSNGEVVPTPVPPPCRKRVSDDSSPEKREKSELKDRGGFPPAGTPKLNISLSVVLQSSRESSSDEREAEVFCKCQQNLPPNGKNGGIYKILNVKRYGNLVGGILRFCELYRRDPLVF